MGRLPLRGVGACRCQALSIRHARSQNQSRVTGYVKISTIWAAISCQPARGCVWVDGAASNVVILLPTRARVCYIDYVVPQGKSGANAVASRMPLSSRMSAIDSPRMSTVSVEGMQSARRGGRHVVGLLASWGQADRLVWREPDPTHNTYTQVLPPDTSARPRASRERRARLREHVTSPVSRIGQVDRSQTSG